ncbi:PAS domain S-box protein [Arcicella aquatica]|uniref:histidine kinase n=1 Tax=Arcicella aquatica TaxID=217141 RepID=A0ABU5QKK0_9BACT|nr:PAS domain S-box protein [Arcicella aquatica]MEA5257369.1 PAS domain S-box protein [Arcicella aquatica]
MNTLESEPRIRQNFENINNNSLVAMFQLVLSSEGNISFPYVNKVIEKIFFNVDKHIFQNNPSTYFQSIIKDDYEGFFTSLQTSQKELNNWLYEFRICNDDIHFKWIQVFASPERNEDGLIIWHGYFKDITFLKANEDILKLKENRFFSIIENCHEGYALLDSDGTFLEVSPTGKRILGFSNDVSTDFIKNNIKINTEDRELLATAFINSIANPKESKKVECRIISTDDTENWLEVTIHNLQKNHAIQAILLNFRDINEQVIARKQKEFDAKNLKSLIDNTSEIVWSVDTSFRLISYNAAFEKLIFDYSGECIYPGKNVLETLKDMPAHLALYTAYYERALKGETFTEQYNISYLKNLWREVSFYPIKIEDKLIGAACYGKDITERKLSEFALQKTNEQLLAAQNIARLGYWEIDLIEQSSHWSEEMYNIFEIAPDQSPLNLDEALNYVYESDKEKLIEQHELMMREDKYLYIDFRLKMSDCRIKYIVMDAKLIRDEEGKAAQIRITSQDVTEKKRAERDIIEKEKRFKALIEKSLEGIAIVDVNQKIIEISPGGKNIFGITSLEEYNRALVHPDDLKELGAIFQKVYSDPNYSPTASLRYTKPTGELVWIETQFNNQLAEPSIKGIVMNFRDITERRKAEQLLKAEQYLLRTIVDNLPLNVYVKDLASRKTLINKAELEYLGFKEEKEGLGKNDYETFTEEYAKIFMEEDQTVFKTGKAIINKETLIDDPSKKRTWYLLSKIPLVNEDGEVDRLIGISINITELKLVEEQLRESELMFKTLAKSVPGVVYQFCVEADGTTHFPYLSSKMADIFGIDFDVNELDLSKHIYHEDKKAFLNSIYVAIQTKSDWHFEGRIHNAKNEIKWFDGIASATMIGQKIVFNGILIDITERKNAEEAKKHLRQLELSLEKEKEINLLKSRFISFASHEFRTPLATIITSIDILGIYTDMLNNIDLKEKIQHHLSRVTLQSNRLTEMLKDVLLLEKTANEKLNLELEYIDIVALVNEINSQYFFDRKDLRKLDLSLPLTKKMIYTDASLLNHVIHNLVDNAFKYSEGMANPSLTLNFNEHNFNIIVKDYGIGIPLEDQQHLFEIFFRANNVLAIEGTGLGLNITKEFTNKLGGTISFESEEGKGTTFTLTFPYQYS